MNRSADHRLSWEYAAGPKVGSEVEITGEPREEVSPGVPRDPAPARDVPRDPAPAREGGAHVAEGRDGDRRESGSELREVRVQDPQLSAETNARLTEELREVVGRKHVRVPSGRPHVSRGEQPSHDSRSGFLGMHRFELVRSTAIVLTFGAIIALVSNDWWVLPLAAGVHALGTMTVWLTTFRLASMTESPSAQLAAALTEQGVASPDEYFSRLVDEFRQAPERGVGEIISPGFNERTVDASRDPAQAGAEQSSAMTPTAAPSRPAGEGGAPDLLIWSTILALLVLSIILPALTGGGWMWLLAAVMVPLLAGWVVFQRVMVTRRDEIHLRGRAPLVAIVAFTVLAVAGFSALVALAFQH